MPRPLPRRLLPRRRRHRLAVALLVLLVLVRPLPTNGSAQQGGAVATRDLAAGTRITAEDVRTLQRDHLVDFEEVRDPVGRVVRQPILEGEPIRAERLGGSGGALSELLEPDERAVQLPVELALPGTATGDMLDLAVRDTHGVRIVATGARVLSVHDSALVVAVRESVAARTGGAALDGTLVVLLAPPP